MQNLSVMATGSDTSEKCTVASSDSSSVLEGNFEPAMVRKEGKYLW